MDYDVCMDTKCAPDLQKMHVWHETSCCPCGVWIEKALYAHKGMWEQWYQETALDMFGDGG